MLPETLAPGGPRLDHAARALAAARGALLRDPDFMGLTFTGGFAMASFFVFIASASFVYTDEFGLSPTGFSLAFAANAIGFFAASQMAASLGERFGMARVVVFAVGTLRGGRRWRCSRWSLAGFGSLPVIIGSAVRRQRLPRRW